MKALQYIYTSWKNGNSTEKGYMIYSRSLGISEEDCTVVKDAMQYMAPKNLNLTPTEQEIAKLFPYSFAYFSLPSGKKCVAQSTYLGKDYSGRYGNYIIYALIFNDGDILCRPYEFFGEKYIKNKMTDEELNASSPVPPLPPLNIETYGTAINDDRLNEFAFEKESELEQLISFVLASSEKKVPLFINDTRENLVLWAASMQRIFPKEIALRLTFNTYFGNHEFLCSKKAADEGIKFCLVGIRPDANYFDYAAERHSNRYFVLDFIKGFKTEGIKISNYAKSMASDMSTNFEEINLFGNFLIEISFVNINEQLIIAYEYYKLLKYGEFDFSNKLLQEIINFGINYCPNDFNEDVACKLLSEAQENNLSISTDAFKNFWDFCCRYAGFMIYTLFELLQNTLFNTISESNSGYEDLLKLTNALKESTPNEYENFLEYENSPQGVDQLLLYMQGNTDIKSNLFYIEWVFDNYKFFNGLGNRQQIDKFLNALLNNISKSKNVEVIMQILFRISSNKNLFKDAVKIFVYPEDSKHLESLCDSYYKLAVNSDKNNLANFENLLIETPDTVNLALNIAVRKIKNSQKPSDEFWRFYSNNKNTLLKIENFSLQPILAAFLKKLEGDTKEKNIVRILNELAEQFLNDRETSLMLATDLESFSIKSLSDISGRRLESFYKNYHNEISTSAPKIESVVLGNFFLNLPSVQKVNLATVLENCKFNFSTFNKKDYCSYLEKYCELYFQAIKIEQDLICLLELFYNEKNFDEFLKIYIKYIKRAKNTDNALWKNLITWSASYILKNSQETLVKKLNDSFTRYLRGLDEVDLSNLKKSLAREELPQDKINSFFENVNRKESLYEKLTSIFRR